MRHIVFLSFFQCGYDILLYHVLHINSQIFLDIIRDFLFIIHYTFSILYYQEEKESIL